MDAKAKMTNFLHLVDSILFTIIGHTIAKQLGQFMLYLGE